MNDKPQCYYLDIRSSNCFAYGKMQSRSNTDSQDRYHWSLMDKTNKNFRHVCRLHLHRYSYILDVFLSRSMDNSYKQIHRILGRQCRHTRGIPLLYFLDNIGKKFHRTYHRLHTYNSGTFLIEMNKNEFECTLKM